MSDPATTNEEIVNIKNITYVYVFLNALTVIGALGKVFGTLFELDKIIID